MNPSDVLLPFETGKRARNLDDAMIAARREMQPVGRVAHEREPRLIGLCHLVEQGRRTGRISQGSLEARRPVALAPALARRGAYEVVAPCWVEKPCWHAEALCVTPQTGGSSRA
jgi:hypothetical protein